MSGKIGTVGLLGCVFLGTASAAELTLVDQGKARVCVVVPAKAIGAKGATADPAFEHHRLAAKDLADYLGKMSGATVMVGDKPAVGLVPIYVGAAPAKNPLTRRRPDRLQSLLEHRQSERGHLDDAQGQHPGMEGALPAGGGLPLQLQPG